MGMNEKLEKWRSKLKIHHMFTVIVICLIVAIFSGAYAYKKQTEYRQVMENQYNMAFFELVDYIQNVEVFLAKAMITSTPEHSAETLTNVWREANLALSSLGQLPIANNELSSTSKFLNQVSDYAYSLSRKNIYNESLTDEELNNLKTLYYHSVDLENTLNQLSDDLNSGKIKWGELTQKGTVAFAQQVSNISLDSFSSMDQNLQEYAGLIYDGAFSEHITSMDKKGLTGEDISEEQAKKKVEEVIGKERIKEITSYGLSEGDMESYSFSVAMQNGDNNNKAYIDISKKGGHVILMNFNRFVKEHTIDENRAIEIGKEFLNRNGYPNMKETYYLDYDGIITINYAYEQNGIVIYPDLIKVKIALDNGEIMGMETKGYLNNHYEREIELAKINKVEAKKDLNKNLNILSENLTIIPTKWHTEILCWEFKGRIEEKDFLVYINAENGREENILVIVNTPNGTLTM